jgi:hypothetical protein
LRRTIAFYAVVWIAGFILSSIAHGQTLQQAGPWVRGHPSVYNNSGATPIVQDAGPAKGGPPAQAPGLSEILSVVPQGAGSPPWASSGTGPFGSNICDYDAPVTNPTGFHYLCLSPNSNGVGLIAFGAVGAPQIPLYFNVNGVTFPAGSGGGGGGSLIVGTTPVAGGTTGYGLYDNAGILGDFAINSSILTLLGQAPNAIGGLLTGPVDVPLGGTGDTTFTPGLPLLGAGASALTQGTISGNTTELVTGSGAFTSGHCPQFDANGNLVDSGAGCAGGGGSITLTIGTTSVSGATNGYGLFNNAGLLGQFALPLTVPNGGTGATTLTANAPVIGNGTSAVTTGARTGNTTTFATSTGSLTSGHCAQWDGNGNAVDAGGPCGGAVTGLPSVATVAALKAQTAGFAQTVHIQGYYGGGDGGEGNFDWNASCPATTDNGVYIAPNSGTGCWVREAYGSPPNIRWWGAHCDFNGSAGTDDKTIIQTAINWVQLGNVGSAAVGDAVGGTLYWPKGCNEGVSDTVFVSIGNTMLSGWAPAGAGVGSPGDCSALIGALTSYAHAADPIIAVGPLPTSYGSGQGAIGGSGVANMCIYGNGKAQTGLRIASEFGCSVHDIFIGDAIFRPLLITVANAYNGGHTLATDSNTQNCLFQNIYVDATSITGANDAGIAEEAWGNVSNPSLNQWSNLKIIGHGDPGIRIAGSDGDTWTNVQIFLSSGAAANAVIITANDIGPGTFYSNNEMFQGLQTSSQIILGPNTTLDTFVPIGGNGTPAPTCQSGAHGSWLFTGTITIQGC